MENFLLIGSYAMHALVLSMDCINAAVEKNYELYAFIIGNCITNSKNRNSILANSHAPTYFHSIGACIYCGDKKPKLKLSAEHIIPYGLSGNLVMWKADCASCRKITNKYENSVLITTFRILRASLRTATRSPKNRPLFFSGQVMGSDGYLRVVKLPIEDYPFIQMFMPPETPGIFNGIESGIILKQVEIAISPLRGKLPSGMAICSEWTPDDFGRLLAKIAHAYGVAMRALTENYETLLNDVILCKSAAVWSFVGTLKDVNSVNPEWHPNEVFNRIGFFHRKSSSGSFLCVAIQLFAKNETPIYQVAIGRERAAS